MKIFLRTGLSLFLAGSASGNLTDDGRRAVADHAWLFQQVARTYTMEYGSGDPGPQPIKAMEIPVKPIELDGEYAWTVPSELHRVVQFFYGFELHGAGLNRLMEGNLLPVAPDRKMTLSRRGERRLTLKVSNLPIFDGKEHDFILRLKGAGRVERIRLVARGAGIPPVLDTTRYRNLGYDEPPLPLTVSLDLTTEQAIGGQVELDRSKWWRVYGRPGSVPPELEQHVAERGFQAGRQMIKFRYALEQGYSKQAPKLKEHPTKPGWADPAFFDVYEDRMFEGVPA
ncbi:MAG: hypothetical protein AAF492_02160, partial [Verrucomicrobiota bacterium]